MKKLAALGGAVAMFLASAGAALAFGVYVENNGSVFQNVMSTSTANSGYNSVKTSGVSFGSVDQNGWLMTGDVASVTQSEAVANQFVTGISTWLPTTVKNNGFMTMQMVDAMSDGDSGHNVKQVSTVNFASVDQNGLISTGDVAGQAVSKVWANIFNTQIH